jgi:predicted HicB family RNase H-like nuclease
MQPEKPKRLTKTFPLEIEDDLHKALKVRAIEEDKTLHSLIIETLSSRVQEEPARYRVTKPKKGGGL